MKFLLFFITSIFSAIFFIFYKLNSGINIFSGYIGEEKYFSSFTGNLFYESIFFIVLALFLFFYFSSFVFSRKNNEEQNIDSPIGNIGDDNLDNDDFVEKRKLINFRKIISDYIYYIGFGFFYTSVYLILKSFGITDFSYLILFLNFIIFVFFFLSHKATLFKDFIKINTILFSLYYIFVYLKIFITGENNLGNIDLINTFFIFSFFIITFYGDYKKGKVKQNIIHHPSGASFNTKGSIEVYADNSLILYFFLYSFIVFSFYFKNIFGIIFNLENINFILIFIYISIFFNLIIYFIFQKIKFLEKSKYTLRALSFLFGYVSIIFGIIYFIKNLDFIFFTTFWQSLNNLLIIFILIYGIFFNYFIHKKFENYISLFFSLLSFIFLLNFLLIKNIELFGGNLINLELVLNLTISFFIVIFTYLYNQKYELDNIFLHICAYLVNLLGITYYFVYGNFELLNLGIILLLDSILIFLSYFKLKKIGR